FNEFGSFAANAGLEDIIVRPVEPSLYLTELNANKVAKMPTAGGPITEFSTGTNSHPFGITDGPDGNIWVALQGKNAIASLDPALTTLTSHTIPTMQSWPTDIATGKNKLFFWEGGSQK